MSVFRSNQNHLQRNIEIPARVPGGRTEDGASESSIIQFSAPSHEAFKVVVEIPEGLMTTPTPPRTPLKAGKRREVRGSGGGRR